MRHDTFIKLYGYSIKQNGASNSCTAVGKANHRDICAAGAASQKVGNEPKALRVRLQTNRRCERDLLRIRRSSGMSEL